MNKILTYIKKFMSSVESTNCDPKSTEFIDGKAFEYKTYLFSDGEMHCSPDDTINATITDIKHGQFSISEKNRKTNDN